MARRRVLALGPAVSRMICMTHPYQQLQRSEENTAKPKRTWLWRRKKSSRVKKMRAGERPRRRWGLRVGRLRIRLLSPFALLKRLCDSYVRMMFMLENKMGGAGIQCAAGPAFPMYPIHIPPRIDYGVKVKVN